MNPPWMPPHECTDPKYTWLRNSEGQSACEILWEVGISQCFELSQVKQKPLDQSDCACSTVPYSLLYACGMCTDQQQFQITFGEYSGILDCENTAPIGQYSGLAGAGGTIPPWATLPDLADNDSFDVAKAQQVAEEFSSGGRDTPPANSPSPKPTTAAVTPSEPSLGITESPAPTGGSMILSPSPSSPTAGLAMWSASNNDVPGYTVGELGPSSVAQENGSSVTGSNETISSGTGSLGVDANYPPYRANDRNPSASGSLPANIATAGKDSQPASPFTTTGGGSAATPSTSSQGAISKANQIGPIVGGVVGSIILIALALAAALLFLRHRRRLRHRNKRATLAQAALEWENQPKLNPYIRPSVAEPDASVCSATGGLAYDGESEAATLRGDDEFTEKKSVTYGDYPEY